MAVAIAKWLVLATGFCRWKRVQSAIGKLRWLARPHACLSLVMAGPCAHSWWGPRFLPHTPLAILRNFASVLAISFQVTRITTTTSFVALRFVACRNLLALNLWGILFLLMRLGNVKICLGVCFVRRNVSFGWFCSKVMTRLCAELSALCQAFRWAVNRGWKHPCLVVVSLGKAIASQGA